MINVQEKPVVSRLYEMAVLVSEGEVTLRLLLSGTHLDLTGVNNKTAI